MKKFIKYLSVLVFVNGSVNCSNVYSQTTTLITELFPGDTIIGIYSNGHPGAMTFNIENTNDTAYVLKQVEKYLNYARIYSGTIPKLWYSATSLAGASTIAETNGWTIITTGSPLYYSQFGLYPLFQDLNFVIPPNTQYRFAIETSKGIWAGTTPVNTYSENGIIFRVTTATLPGNSEDTIGCNGEMPDLLVDSYGFIGRITLEPATTTPVTLLNLTANYNNKNANIINWQTSQELNSKNFTIQKAYSLPQFANVVTITAAGNSSTIKNYTYTDNNIAYKPTYYRLLQTDIDGKTAYSKTVVVNPFKNSFAIGNLYPSPAKNDISIEYNSPLAGNATILITDMVGRLLVKKSVASIKGSNKTGLDISMLAKGQYTVTLINKENSTHCVFSKE